MATEIKSGNANANDEGSDPSSDIEIAADEECVLVRSGLQEGLDLFSDTMQLKRWAKFECQNSRPTLIVEWVRVLKDYDVGRKCRSVPGTVHTSLKGKVTRLENLLHAVTEWPHLMIYVGESRSSLLAQLGAKLYEDQISQYDVAHFGGVFDQWVPIWDCKPEPVLQGASESALSDVESPHASTRQCAGELS